MKLLSEVRFNNRRFQRTRAGVLGNSLVEMDEPLPDDISLVSEICTLFRSTINERVVPATKFGLMSHSWGSSNTGPRKRRTEKLLASLWFLNSIRAVQSKRPW